MSDLTVKTASESVVSSSRKAAVQTEAKAVSDVGASASARQSSAPDVSNYVTSPKGVVDPSSGVFVLQYRDGATGEVKMQYPSAKAVDAYQRSGGEGTSTEQAASSVTQASGGEATGAGVETSTVSTTTTTTASTAAASAPAPAPSSGGTPSGTGSASTNVDA
ncbi:MAG: hypothetical protein OQK24_03030 [Magnetovibrio sp.]|nr:hypothetical protein [Magnetovibrio sp.]